MVNAHDGAFFGIWVCECRAHRAAVVAAAAGGRLVTFVGYLFQHLMTMIGRKEGKEGRHEGRKSRKKVEFKRWKGGRKGGRKEGRS